MNNNEKKKKENKWLDLVYTPKLNLEDLKNIQVETSPSWVIPQSQLRIYWPGGRRVNSWPLKSYIKKKIILNDKNFFYQLMASADMPTNFSFSSLKWLLARVKMVILRQHHPPPLKCTPNKNSSDLYHLKFQVLEEIKKKKNK